MRRADDIARLESFIPAASRIAMTYAAHGDAADLRQEILTQLWRSRRHFDGQSQYATWAYRVALNTAIDHIRRDRHRRTTLERFRLLDRREAKGETLMLLHARCKSSRGSVTRSMLPSVRYSRCIWRAWNMPG